MNGLIRIQAKFFILEKDVILNIVQNVNQEGRNNLLANVQRLSKAHKEPYNRFFFVEVSRVHYKPLVVETEGVLTSKVEDNDIVLSM